MIDAPQYVVHGWHTMCLAGTILCTDKHMLVNTNATHNPTDIITATI
jgi:hypothetical protein